ncbi:hypothetical protein IGS68_33600 (plasmid) [Skermanella sp. TT6]|uniref:Uncharacterized protein n=1 Tax=Skermanella cutis TaxID=2775420 RepID=A0ABX7BM90_9PROT|nr:hypothetical protein [Skermanella sp. TT6]QQP93558.1 hypothetical protein IGS68_33600 [Skermanella sp. TT6]
MSTSYRVLGSPRFTRQNLTATTSTAALLTGQYFGGGSSKTPVSGALDLRWDVAAATGSPDREIVKRARPWKLDLIGQYSGLRALFAWLEPGWEAPPVDSSATTPNIVNPADNLAYGGLGNRDNTAIGNCFRPAGGSSDNGVPASTLSQWGVTGTSVTVFARVEPYGPDYGTDLVLFGIPTTGGGWLTWDFYGSIWELYDGSTFTTLGNRPATVTQTVALTISGTTAKAYVNGVLKATITTPGLDTSRKIAVGYDPRGQYQKFQTLIYEIGATNTVWSDAEVANYDSYPLGMLDTTTDSPTLPAVLGTTTANWAGAYPYNHAVSHNATGASALLVFASSAGGYTWDPTASFAGQAMTLLGRSTSSGGQGTLWVFALNNPPQTTGNIVISKADQYCDTGVTSAINLANTQASNPFGGFAAAHANASVTLEATNTGKNRLLIGSSHDHYTSGGALTASGAAILFENKANPNHQQVGFVREVDAPGVQATTFSAPFNSVGAAVVLVEPLAAAAGVKTPVSTSIDARWNDRVAVAGAIDARWNDRATAAGNVETRWHDRTKTTGSIDARWNDRANVTGSVEARWHDKAAVAGLLDARWDTASATVRVAVGSSIDARWHDRTAVADAVDARWNDRAALNAALDARYNIRTTAASAADLRYSIRQTIGEIVTTLWHDRTTVSAGRDFRWDDRTTLPATTELRYSIRSALPQSLDVRWDDRGRVGQGAELRWNIQQTISASAAALEMSWHVRERVQRDIDARFDVRGKAASPIDLRWHDRALSGVPIDVRWGIRQPIAQVIEHPWAIRDRVGLPLDLLWDDREAAGLSVDLPYDLRATIGRLIDLRWNDLAIGQGSTRTVIRLTGQQPAGIHLTGVNPVQPRMLTGVELNTRLTGKGSS